MLRNRLTFMIRLRREAWYNHHMTMPYTTDTSPTADAVQLELWRAMSGQERIQKTCSLSSHLRKMAFDAIRKRHPEFTDDQVQIKFVELSYGKELASALAEWKLRNC